MAIARGVTLLLLTLTPVTALADPLGGGKLLLTNGITTIDGASGGGISSWSAIAGNEVGAGVGIGAHATAIFLPDFEWRSFGAAVGIADRLEFSYARQSFDTGRFGAALGIGRGYTFNQDVFGAKLRLAGDIVYDSPLLPQIAVGVQHKRSGDDDLVRAIGARRSADTDVYVSATKLLLAQSVLASAALRLTRANQGGLLGYGGDKGDAREIEFEGTLAYQLSRRFVVGGEYRSKPDKLGFAAESDWFDLFAAYALTRNVTAAAAYVDLGSIATARPQRGVFLSLQAGF